VVELRELTRTDMDYINRWRNDAALIALLGAPFRFINRETDEEWFDAYQRNRHRQVRCCIWLADVDEPVGLVSLTAIDAVYRCAEFHIMIGSAEHRRSGIGALAANAMLRHAFEDLNLNRVSLQVVEDNASAARFYEKLGFVREGILRSAILKQGHFRNVIVMSMLRHEFGRRSDVSATAAQRVRF
jgi:UDP-4-amino-4,6-dideoxy-N-acetyl-beta-L-altrosamine N-acetyltransferase